MYQIAKFMDLYHRKAAAAAEYATDGLGGPPRNCEDRCALGVAYLGIGKTPPAYKVAQWIIGRESLSMTQAEYEQYKVICDAAERFINDFDRGKIKDVARAMGVTVKK
jgi:hypothetical protein